MKYTKEYLVNEYLKLKEHLGQSPTSTVFYEQTGIHKRHLEKNFGSNSFSKLVTECGDTPKDFFKPKSQINDILNQWGNLAKKLNKLPTTADWSFYDCKPTTQGIMRSHNLKWAEIPYMFLEHYSTDSDWQDIVALIPNSIMGNNPIPKSISKMEGLTFDLLKFIPPVVQDLIEQSSNEEKARDFEINVNLVFQMLGFEVINYGQGTGRNPDGIAKENQHRYAILIDAKSRGNKYKMGTEDRKFIEYIKTFSEPLRKQGFTNIYFLIVSSEFQTISSTAIKNIKVETQIPTTLLTSRQLLKMLAKKIQIPRLFDLKKFQDLLIEDGEITDKKIDKFLASIK